MGSQLGVNQSVFDVAEIRRESKIEPEHGLRAPEGQLRCVVHQQDCLGKPQGIPRLQHMLDNGGTLCIKHRPSVTLGMNG
jgi:hypothetical protein